VLTTKLNGTVIHFLKKESQRFPEKNIFPYRQVDLALLYTMSIYLKDNLKSMDSSSDDHLTDIISIVQASPKSPAPVETEPESTKTEQPEPAAPVQSEPTAPVQSEPKEAPAEPQEVVTEPAPAPEAKPAKPPKKKSRAGRKPLPDKNRRSEILIIRLTKAEKKKLWELAKKKHTTLSSFVRKTSIGEYDKD